MNNINEKQRLAAVMALAAVAGPSFSQFEGRLKGRYSGQSKEDAQEAIKQAAEKRLRKANARQKEARFRNVGLERQASNVYDALCQDLTSGYILGYFADIRQEALSHIRVLIQNGYYSPESVRRHEHLNICPVSIEKEVEFFSKTEETRTAYLCLVTLMLLQHAAYREEVDYEEWTEVYVQMVETLRSENDIATTCLSTLLSKHRERKLKRTTLY